MTSEDEAAVNSPNIYFREWRLYRGMTQAQVQQRLGWSEGRLSKMESGVVSTKPVGLSELAQIYGCDIGDLFRPPPTSTERGLFGLVELRRLIARLQHDVAELKLTVVPRIEALERQLAEVDSVSEAAARNADELAELFGRYASQISRGAPARK